MQTHRITSIIEISTENVHTDQSCSFTLVVMWLHI